MGHSRKLDLRSLLELIQEPQTVGVVKTAAQTTFLVTQRTVELGLAGLEQGGFLVRVRPREGDQRRQLVSLTALGQSALDDPEVAETLLALPMRHREERAWMNDPTNPAIAQARLDRWRDEMRS